jgi:hypothetical protein
MSDLDSRLTAALQANAAPAYDPMFRVEVLVRLERARFRRRIAMTMVVAFVAAALVAVNAESITAWMTTDIRHVLFAALGAMAGLFALCGVPVEALPGARLLASALSRWLYP